MFFREFNDVIKSDNVFKLLLIIFKQNLRQLQIDFFVKF